MGIKLSSIVNTTVEVVASVPIFDIEIRAKFLPGLFTPELEDQIEALTKQGLMGRNVQAEELEEYQTQVAATGEQPPTPKQFNYTVEMLQQLVTWWDITDDEEKMLSLKDTHVVRKVPYPILNALLFAIMDKMRPKTKS